MRNIGSSELEKIMTEAGKILCSRSSGSDLGIVQKDGDANFATAYDLASQQFLEEKLRKLVPEAAFVGEEGEHAGEETSLRWVVDPLDGTTNFIHDMRESCISVALCEGHETLLAGIWHPWRREFFFAEKGEGAFCNGERVKIACRPLKDALVIFGTTPYNKAMGHRTFGLAEKIFASVGDVRRSGTAAWDMSTVAAGRADAFWECRLAPWDFAAGMLLVTEAGGQSVTFDGRPTDPCHGGPVLCGPSPMVEFLLPLVREIPPVD